MVFNLANCTSGNFFETSHGLTNEDFVHYEDQIFKFSAWFPSTWKKVPTSHSETRLKVVSDAGHGVDDFSIVAMYFDNLKHTAPDDIDKMTLGPKEYLRNLKTSAPDANLVESGSTHLSNQPARFYITEFTVKSMGIEVPMKQLQVQTLRNGFVYTLTCRTEPGRFDAMLPVFELIMAGFVIKPVL